MKVPLNDKEAKRFVEESSDETIGGLVSIYEEIKKFEDALNFIDKSIDPITYNKMKDEYFQKLFILQDEFIKNAEEVQKNANERLEAEEAKYINEIDSKVARSMEEINNLEKQRNSLHQYMDRRVSSL